MSNNAPARISGWLKNSFIDFPGTAATVLFFSGCNLQCPYCHNPDIVQGATEPVDFADIIDFLKRRRGMIEGVVLSGGEPTIHEASLLLIAEQIRELGYKIKLDTNGLRPATITRLAPDYLALDIKTAPRRYAELGYSGNDQTVKLAESLLMVRSMGKNAEVRITVAAPFLDEQTVEELVVLLSGMHTIYLQPCIFNNNHLDNTVARTCASTEDILQRLQQMYSLIADKCVIRGR